MPVTIFPIQPMATGLGDIGSHIRMARNLLPIGGVYRPGKAQEQNPALTMTGTPPNAIHTHRYPSGAGTTSYSGDQSTTFVGTRTRLYQLTNDRSVAADISRAANYAQAVGDSPASWSFLSFGNDIWATNYVDEMQLRANNAGLFANGITSAFKPQSRFIDVLRTSLIAANLESAGGTRFADEYSISVPGNAASHDPAGGAVTNRSLARPGQITGLVGGEYARIFKLSSMSAINYTGSSINLWREDLLSGSVGTPFGKSIVETKGGDIAFWGGDSFYRQSGMNPPTRIGGSQLGNHLLEYGLTDPELSPLALVVYPDEMLREDKIIHGARCSRTGIVFWYLELDDDGPSGVAPPPAKVDYVAWDPESDLWTWGRSQYPVSCIGSFPDLGASFMVSGVGGLTWDGTSARWFRFSADLTEEVTIAWAANPLDLVGADAPPTFKVKGVMPIISWRSDATVPPPGVTVTVTVYDDPYLNAISGAQPRTATVRLGTHNSEWGWMNEPLLGSFVKVTLTIEATAYAIQAIHGVAVDYEVAQ